MCGDHVVVDVNGKELVFIHKFRIHSGGENHILTDCTIQYLCHENVFFLLTLVCKNLFVNRVDRRDRFVYDIHDMIFVKLFHEFSQIWIFYEIKIVRLSYSSKHGRSERSYLSLFFSSQSLIGIKEIGVRIDPNLINSVEVIPLSDLSNPPLRSR
uniref:ORF19 n=1 Tax=Malaco herpesvirus 1 TaxID=3031797 RepID=A0AA48SF05_9VIRU|nr:TPA_asm: ORF19 [Malaco herpesvirus 1]